MTPYVLTLSAASELKTGGREKDGWQGVEAQPRQVHQDLLLRLLVLLVRRRQEMRRHPRQEPRQGEEEKTVGVQNALNRADFKMAVSRLICVVEQK